MVAELGSGGKTLDRSCLLAPWAGLRHPICFLRESGVVACASPSWSLLARGAVGSPWLWSEGANGLEQLRLAAQHGDAVAALTVERLESVLRGSSPGSRQPLSLPLNQSQVPFVWTAVAVRSPRPGAVVSMIERRAPRASSGVCLVDLQGRLLEHDVAFADLVGESKLEGRSLWEILATLDESLAAVLQATVPSVSASELEWCWQPTCTWLEVCWFPRDGHTRLVFSPLEPSRARELAVRYGSPCDPRQVEQRKLEAIQRLAGGVAHDFNNRLSEILGNAELALTSGRMSDDLRDAFENIADSARRSATLVRQLLAFARAHTISPRTFDLNSTIDELLDLRKELVDERIRLTWTPDPQTPLVKADPAQVKEMLAHLVSNARDAVLQERASGRAGEIRISTSPRIVDEETCRIHSGISPGVFANIEVSDNGCGLDESLGPKIFEPFFTTKKAGSGMGLPTVEGMAEQNGGFVEVVSVPGKGSSFRVVLPSPQSQESVVPTSTQAAGDAGSPRTVLLVDDEASLLTLCKRRLQRLGYEVLVAQRPATALEMVAEHPRPIEILLTDVQMPGMNGLELSRKVHEMRPEIATVFMSGYTASLLSESGQLDSETIFLSKPFSEAELGQALERAVSSVAHSRLP